MSWIRNKRFRLYPNQWKKAAFAHMPFYEINLSLLTEEQLFKKLKFKDMITKKKKKGEEREQTETSVWTADLRVVSILTLFFSNFLRANSLSILSKLHSALSISAWNLHFSSSNPPPPPLNSWKSCSSSSSTLSLLSATDVFGLELEAFKSSDGSLPAVGGSLFSWSNRFSSFPL